MLRVIVYGLMFVFCLADVACYWNASDYLIRTRRWSAPWRWVPGSGFVGIALKRRDGR